MKIDKNQKGYGLLEILLILGFVAIVMTIIFISYSIIKNKSDVSNEIKNYSAYSAFLSSNKYNSYDYVSNEYMISSKVLDNRILDETVLHRLGNNDSKLNFGSSKDNRYYYFIYNNVSKNKCLPFIAGIKNMSSGISVSESNGSGSDELVGGYDMANWTQKSSRTSKGYGAFGKEETTTVWTNKDGDEFTQRTTKRWKDRYSDNPYQSETSTLYDGMSQIGSITDGVLNYGTDFSGKIGVSDNSFDGALKGKVLKDSDTDFNINDAIDACNNESSTIYVFNK